MSSYNTAPSEGHTSALAIEKITRRTEPTQHLYQGHRYTPAAQMAVRVPVAFFSHPKAQ